MRKIGQFMMNKRVWPFLVPVIALLVFVGIKSWGSGRSNEPGSKYERILTIVADLLEQGHYSPKRLDDNFSKQVFKTYLNSSDPDRTIFLKSDIDALKQYELKIEDELKNG